MIRGRESYIDDLVIYDRALSAAEIATHAAAVPEPATIVLLLLASLGITAVSRRWR